MVVEKIESAKAVERSLSRSLERPIFR